MIYKNNKLMDLDGVKGDYISDIEIKKLRKIPDERGTIYHMLRNDDEFFKTFGEIYFSTVHPQVVKGWHLHTLMTLNYAVIDGMIKLVLYDERKDSETQGNIMEIFVGEENYMLIKIPPHIWNGFKGIGEKKAIVANFSSIAHDPKEIFRKDPFTEDIPYDWMIKHE
jgi:dTDP-4-dehydrorhamnose 3,5-epimerase